MIKVGVLLNFPVSYKGGINYLKNLFFAINKFYSDKVTILLFVPEGLDKEYLDIFSPYCSIVETSILKRKSLSWLVSRVGEKFLGFDILCYLLLKKYKIDIVSHSNYVFPTKEIKSINWIPDFQYLYYPNLWTKSQLRSEYALHLKWVKKSSLIILSSYNSFSDFKQFFGEQYVEKVRVLRFVSQSEVLNQNLKTKFSYSSSKFFYLPNQFWEHKNHFIVLKAVKVLRDKGISVLILLSGLMKDFRNQNNHIQKLKDFVRENKLSENIKFLGLIPYSDVLDLIQESKAVINPSLFEGWSSTVEEAKAINKRILLSDIPVHREQAPPNGIFFNPNNENDLAEKMEFVWKEKDFEPDIDKIKTNLDLRTRVFADEFFNILQEVIVVRGK